jgi:phosphoglycerol transferase MdoB-like AlkP superfamily enzyme
MTSFWFLSLLVLMWVGTVRVLEALPDRALLRRLVVAAVIASVLVLTFLAYPSDPRVWTAAKSALFLAEPRFDLLAILGSTLTGSVLVGLWVVGIYWANRRR